MKISARRIGLLVWLAILIFLYVFGIYFTSSHSSDYRIFYSSLRLLLDGKNIYTSVPIDSLNLIDLQNIPQQTRHPNLNSPFFTLLLSPLGLLPYAASFWVWSLLSLAFGMTGIFLMLRTEGRTDIDSILVLLLLLLGYFPTLANILLGQTGLPVFMLVAGGWAAAREGRDRTGGMLLGLGLGMKVFLGLFLVYFLVQRRWRLLFWTAATFAACWLIGLLFLGPNAYVQYSMALQSVTWYSTNWNASSYGFLTRIFGGSENLPLIDFPLLGQALYFSSSLLLLAPVLWLARADHGTDPIMRFDLGFSFTLVAALLISPLGWMYYFPLLLIPFLVLFRLANSYALGWNFKGAAILALLLSNFPQGLVSSRESAPFAFTRAAVYHYALILMAALLVWASSALQKQALPLARHTRPAGTLADNNRLLYVFLGIVLYYAVAGMLYSVMDENSPNTSAVRPSLTHSRSPLTMSNTSAWGIACQRLNIRNLW